MQNFFQNVFNVENIINHCYGLAIKDDLMTPQMEYNLAIYRLLLFNGKFLSIKHTDPFLVGDVSIFRISQGNIKM